MYIDTKSGSCMWRKSLAIQKITNVRKRGKNTDYSK
jgi:hypothetical protein